MKNTVCVFGVICLFASSLLGATFFIGGGTNEWKTPTNWSNGLPSSTNSGIVPNTTGLTCYIHDSAAVSMNAYVGYYAKDGTLSMDGGTLTIGTGANTFSIGESAVGTFTLSGGTATNNGNLYLGNKPGAIAGNGTMVMSGNTTVLTTTNMFLGYADANTVGTVNMSGGSLTVGTGTSDFSIGTKGTGTFTLSGGNVTHNGVLYLGGYTSAADTGNGTLTITGSATLTTRFISIATKTGSTGKLNLYGGKISITDSSESGFLLHYGLVPGNGYLDIKGKGVLEWKGNHVDQLNSLKNDSRGSIYTSETGKTKNDITVEYIAGIDKTLLYIAKNFPASSGDLNKSGMVDNYDLALMASNWLQWKATSLTNPNPVIFAPHTASIGGLDGDIYDWTSSSDWVTFGKWYEYGLTSTTRAKYAWNATEKRLYIGIETTQPGDIIIEIAGLMGDPDTDPNSKVGTSGKTAFYELKVSGSTLTIDNSALGRSITGVQAAWVNGTTRTFEISTPIYTDWASGAGEHSLAANTTIYEYANLYSDYYEAGDSQVQGDGLGFYLSGAPLMQVGTAIRLLNALPATCSDMPAGRGNLANIAGGDCIVNFSDFAALAKDWLSCTLPYNCQ